MTTQCYSLLVSGLQIRACFKSIIQRLMSCIGSVHLDMAWCLGHSLHVCQCIKWAELFRAVFIHFYIACQLI